MDYIVYKTTNLVNGRYYIGYHRTEDASVFDRYLGSGHLIKRAINKHGKENFHRETIAVCESAEDASDLENLVVSYFIGNPDCYNIAHGGRGGNLLTNQETREKFIHSMLRVNATEEMKKKRSESAKALWKRPETRDRLLASRRRMHLNENLINYRRTQGWDKSREKWLRVEEIQRIWKENNEPGYQVLNKLLMNLGYPHQNLQKVVRTFSTINYSTDTTYQQWKYSRLKSSDPILQR